MAVGTTPPTPTTLHGTRAEAGFPFIRKQLNRARRKIRLVELSVATIQLLAIWCGTLGLLVLIDHWLWNLPVWLRWATVWGLGGVTIFWLIWRVGPLVLYSVHPLYAARQLEEAKPWLKNSLLNYLFLRRQPERVAPAVLEAVELAAADNLKRVPVDESIDRTHAIRYLMVLAFLVAIASLYQLWSPKSSWRSVQRILLPWQDLARPSRVEILQVQPGDVEVPYGQRVSIEVTVRGARAKEPATLYYSTSDGSAVDAPAPLSTEDGRVYRGMFPPGEAGLRQNSLYWIAIGDARSRQFRIDVLQQPVISVTRVDYEYPTYMNRPPVRQTTGGAIEAPEGTRVTIHAASNLAIREAYLEWDPPSPSADPKAHMIMRSEGQSADTSFVLEWLPDRGSSWHSSYRIHYVAADGRTSAGGEIHPIVVYPDLAPVVAVLQPLRRRIEVPENSQVVIEVRALDPDFGLRTVSLEGEVDAGDNWSELLLEDARGWIGQFIKKIVVVPSARNWRAGQTIGFHAVARDNRHDRTGNWDPNEVKTPEYQLVITAPIQAPRAPESAAKAAQQPEQAESQPSPPDKAQDHDSAKSQGTKTPQTSSGEAIPDSQQQASSKSASDGTSGAAQSEDQQGENDSAKDAGQMPDIAKPPGKDKSDDRPAQVGSSGQQSEGQKATSSGQPSKQPRNGSQRAADTKPSEASPTAEQQPQTTRGSSTSQGKSPTDVQDQADKVPRSGEGTPGGRSETQAGSPAGETLDNLPSAGRGSEKAQPSSERPMTGAERSDTPDAVAPSEPATNPKASSESPPDNTRPDVASPERRTSELIRQSEPSARSDTQESAGKFEPATELPDTPDPMTEPRKDLHDGEVFELVRRFLEQQKQGEPTFGTRPSPAGLPESPTPSDKSGGQNMDRKHRTDGSQSATEKRAPAGEPLPEAASRQDKPVGQENAGNPASQRAAPDMARASSDGLNQADAGGRTAPDAGRGQSEPYSERNSTLTQDKDRASAGQGQVSAGGAPRDGPASPAPSLSGSTTGRDTVDVEPNLKYAEEVTDLVLEYLRDQQQQPAPELLKQLGWTAEQLAEFVRRWEQLKRSARENPAQRAELLEALKSLGLRPPADQLRTESAGTETRQIQSVGGELSAPPARYRELFNAFRKATARAAQEARPEGSP